MFGLRWAQKTKPCFVTLELFSARLPVKVFKTLNGLYIKALCDLQGVLVVDIDLIIILNSIFPTENDNDTLASSKGLLFDPFN